MPSAYQSVDASIISEGAEQHCYLLSLKVLGYGSTPSCQFYTTRSNIVTGTSVELEFYRRMNIVIEAYLPLRPESVASTPTPLGIA